ncbi:STAS/SEC14 domain-containing protein [Sphingomonas sp. STIS6.2]|uniref:STAS/SEC14 domain-containing protein n=1 Tax=Sphingomonas sp. STIS6.2 TaxID=1379700 RepID=UPI0004DB7237|nr:STAS/SEC14 domain-containing protein [Sphingomonas sp. STIS6.2]
MPSEFAIAADPLLGLIQIDMSGFFLEADIRAFEEARNEAHSQLRCGPNEHLTLVDIRSMQIQSQEAVAAFKRILDNPAYKSKRIAIVVSHTLASMQIQRAAVDRDVMYFSEDLLVARKWLLNGHI